MHGLIAPPPRPGQDQATEDPVFDRFDVGLKDAMALCMTHRPLVCHYGLAWNQWGETIREALSALPAEVASEGFVPSQASVYVGPFSIPSPDHETTLGSYALQVAVSRDGMPDDWDEYVRLARKTPPLRALLAHLETHSGKPFDVLISSSY